MCTRDGAPAMLGIRSGFAGRVKDVNTDIKSLHSMIHRYVLASNTLPLEVREVINGVINKNVKRS